MKPFKFNQIFIHKGNIGPIAEKARRNFDIIKRNKINQTGRVHHFCVGHKLKIIDKSIFNFMFDDTKETLVATRFTSLEKEKFSFVENLYSVIEDLRNLNSHYVHTFDKIELKEVGYEITEFLKEAFELSVLSNYLEENKVLYDDSLAYDKVLVEYLCRKFYPNKQYQKEEIDRFKKYNLAQAIDDLLFIDIEEDFDWLINGEHNVFTIKRGRYLSFHAQLFLLSLFLYKQEAEQLISKIKGFKRSEDELHYKRDIFTFFSKKVSSQDIDSEEKYLIRFRDIIQYLNKYPIEWNNELEIECSHPKMTNSLEKYLIEFEIFRSFPTYSTEKERNRFLEYAVNQFFSDRAYLFDFSLETFSDEEIKKFNYEIDSSPELKDVDGKLNILKDKYSREKSRLIAKKKKLRKMDNPVKDKLINRINKRSIIKSYGRNQDRFMEIGIRYLAENNYFGKDALFKTYQFYTMDEQSGSLKKMQATMPKKKFDNLKYHQGRLVHYIEYESHLQTYPEWCTPFVLENNAFQVKLKLSDDKYRLFSIQRGLLIYLLEDALYEPEKVEDKGLDLLKNYFENYLIKDFNRVKSDIQKDRITTLHRKLLPSRFLDKKDKSSNPTFENIIEETEQQEKRYNILLKNAIDSNTKEEFLKRNKGKQFKFRFIRKAWNLMYFRAIYEEKAHRLGHHKSFHITKDEFDNFARWMYAFDEVPQYKNYLSRLLKSKGFFEDKEFESLFEKSNSLDELYVSTKQLFENWIENTTVVSRSRDNDYSQIFDKLIVYINLSHFRCFLEKDKFDNKEIEFKSLDNVKYLIPEWYYKDVLPKEEYKTNDKLFNKLRKVKLEDALLYELAMHYLHVDKHIVQYAKKKVSVILNNKISYEIRDGEDRFLYNIIVPFHKLETLAVLIRHKTDQLTEPKYRGTSFLTNLDCFMRKFSESGEIKGIAENYIKHKAISFEDLNKVNNYLISTSINFSVIHMQLEKYYIQKYKTKIVSENRIGSDEIKDDKGRVVLNNYYKAMDRNKAYHFGVPIEKSYIKILQDVEAKFVKNELSNLELVSYSDIPTNIEPLCASFRNILHSNFYKIRGKTKEERNQSLRDFENTYFDIIIKRG